jgi:hypothetical protein
MRQSRTYLFTLTIILLTGRRSFCAIDTSNKLSDTGRGRLRRKGFQVQIR